MIKLALSVSLLFSVAAFAEEQDASANWKKHCKGCHGDEGHADTKKGKELKIDDLTTAAWQKKWTDEKIKKIITEGGEKHDGADSKMKPFNKKLSEKEIDALVKHVRTLAAK